jgi:hypothetical protein
MLEGGAVTAADHHNQDGWTFATYEKYIDAIIRGNDRFIQERDRRYAEVDLEREKALKIKETADHAALDLARQIQAYKDEKANELRAQIDSERGIYATNKDLEPLKAFVNSQTGRGIGMNALLGWAFGLVMAAVALTDLFLRTR